MTAYDEIIVGAGAAGSVLASRLSEQPGRRVLLMEAGPDFTSAESWPEPLRSARAPLMSGYHWDFVAKLNESAQQPFPYGLGKLVGGSSAINGAIALRGFAEDFDRWAALGNTDWRWDEVAPWFARIETDHDVRGPLHGDSGPIPIVRPRREALHPMQAGFFEACRAQGLAELADLNAGSAAGVGPVPSNSMGRQRISAAHAYLSPARVRPTLTIEPECAVHRVLFEGRRAVGVETLRDGRPHAVWARRVTLCAGAINTPLLLQRSGVGSAGLCRSLGIEPVIDLPGVGENLVDHPSVMLWMRPKDDAGAGSLESCHQVLARVASQAGCCPDLQLVLATEVDTDTLPLMRAAMGGPRAHALSVILARPASRGRVRLQDAAAGSPPAIELNFGAAAQDIERLMHGVRLAWRVLRSPQLAPLIDSVFMWTQGTVDNDKALRSAIERRINATWHPVGTARMGPATDPLSVVDARGRVHGLENLCIADASVMPSIPSTPTHLTCIMLAERIAEWMTS